MLPEPVDFSRRAYLSEWMDEPCSYTEFRDCLVDLERLNRLVLAYRPVEQWLQQFLANDRAPLHIVDVGCGGGDMLRRIEAWAHANNLPVKLTGIDLNSFAKQAALEFTAAGSCIEWITGDAFSYKPQGQIDLVVSSLFTHHLSDKDIVRFLVWMEQVSTRGWFINDLHRQRLPYYGYRLLMSLRRWHRFLQHDGPISFRRSFSEEDWRRYTIEAGLEPANLDIYTLRPARLCVSRVR